MKLSVSQRLKVIIDLIPDCSTIIDVGSDHAYVPIYCVNEGKCTFAIASDLNELPCRQSLTNVRSSGLSDKIDVRCGDGLTVIEPGEVQGAVIAGMGGSTIKNILAGSPQVVDSLLFMVLQPQSDEAALRQYLAEHGWWFDDEDLVEENGIIYQVMLVKRSSFCRRLNRLEALFGPVNLRKRRPILQKAISKHLEKLELIAQQLQRSQRPAARQKLECVRGIISELEGALSQWQQ